MNDEAFSRLVAEDVKNKSSEQTKKFLLLPENLERWKRALSFLSSNLREQLTQIERNEQEEIRRYDHLGEEGAITVTELSASFNERKSKIKRFAFFVELKIDEVSRLNSLSSVVNDDNNSQNKEDFFRRAIQKWWQLMEEFDIETTNIDEALHASIYGEWNFDTLHEGNIYKNHSD